MPNSITSSIYRLADATVLITVERTQRGPVLLYTTVSDEPAAVAYTDVDEAKADMPDGYHLYQIPVAELVAKLPAGYGLVIDPRAKTPVHIPAAARTMIADAALPFPPGATVRIGLPRDEPAELLRRAVENVADVAEVRRMYRAWYQVEGAREKLLIAVRGDGAPDAGTLAGRAVIAAAAALDYPYPIEVVDLDDVPEDFRHWILENLEPFYDTCPETA